MLSMHSTWTPAYYISVYVRLELLLQCRGTLDALQCMGLTSIIVTLPVNCT